MAEPVPHLQLLVNEQTGEICEPSPLEIELEMVKRELSGYRLRLAAKEKELRSLQVLEPNAEDVQAVGDYHGRRVVEDGWWTRKPAFRPGMQGWAHVSARLKEPEYDIDYCCAAVEGALMQDKRDTKRDWITTTSIFRPDNIERHYERAQDPQADRVRSWMELAKVFPRRDPRRLSEKCDCGHARIVHPVVKWPGPMLGWHPCNVEGCPCADFSDLHVRADEWLRRQTA